MIDVTKVKSQILYLLKKSNDKTEQNDENLTQAVETLVNGYYDLLMADTVKFSPEHSDTKIIYAMGYNWFADIVKHIQDMSGRNAHMDANDILYWIARVKYLPQGYANGSLSLVNNFNTVVTTLLPSVKKSSTRVEFELSSNNFNTYATKK